MYLYRAKKFDDKATWKANDDGTVNTDGPRMIVGGEGMGMTGGFLTKYVLNLARATLGSQCCTNVSSHSFLFLLFFYCYRCNHFYLLSVCFDIFYQWHDFSDLRILRGVVVTIKHGSPLKTALLTQTVHV